MRLVKIHVSTERWPDTQVFKNKTKDITVFLKKEKKKELTSLSHNCTLDLLCRETLSFTIVGF
jgi:hypothetical protein